MGEAATGGVYNRSSRSNLMAEEVSGSGGRRGLVIMRVDEFEGRRSLVGCGLGSFIYLRSSDLRDKICLATLVFFARHQPHADSASSPPFY